MKHFIISLAAILLFASVSFAQSKDSADRCEVVNNKVGALISQYKTLRDKRRQLPPGIYDRDLSADGGKLSKVLSSLGAELGRLPYTKQNIVDCLGHPDAIKNHKQMGNFLDLYHRELKKAGRKVEKEGNREYLIYFWRGWHDFLFFISEDGAIVDHGWWFAYE
ncbi:MAG: hypothetical protein QOH25_550 [Acidobacteriota bacterium]|jgi:hypothetical protein|nr:hypothetical protein [Acidobacteriota bacterium]